MSKRLKVSDKWVAANVPALRELAVLTPSATPGGCHATRQLRAAVATPGGGEQEYSEAVRYSLRSVCLSALSKGRVLGL